MALWSSLRLVFFALISIAILIAIAFSLLLFAKDFLRLIALLEFLLPLQTLKATSPSVLLLVTLA